MLAEDNPADVILVREALNSHGINYHLEVRTDGEQMLRSIHKLESDGAQCPDLVLLDLNLPRRSGHELLQSLRQNAKCSTVPVVIVTSSDSPKDRTAVADLGANYYFRKPCDFFEFMKLGEVVGGLLEHGPSASVLPVQ